MKNRIILAALAASLLSCSAHAADMPLKAPPLPVPLSAIAGSGFYVGFNGGAAAADQSYQFVTLPGAAAGANGKLFPAGVMGGATVGFGGSLGGIYAAVESDFDYDVTAGETGCAFAATAKLTVNSRCGAKNSWLLSQRLVLGVPLSGLTGAVGKINTTKLAAPSQWPIPIALPTNISVSNVMPFVTGGIAERNVAAYVDPTGMLPSVKGKEAMFPGGHAQEWLVGYVVGGGIRVPLATGWSAKAKYDYIGFNKSFVPANATAGFFNPATFKQINEQRLVMGLDYHF